MSHKKENVLFVVILIYALCFVFRSLEYFILRTDETFLGEAFVHKLTGIIILFIAAKYYDFKLEKIGFAENKIGYNLLRGLVFGLIVFIPAYSAEISVAVVQGKFETLDLYVSAYSVNGTIGNQTGLLFFAICLVGNMINVIMEEGVFRGLFQKILEKRL